MPGTVVVEWVGDVDLATVDEHRRRMARIVDSGTAGSVSLDLAGVEFIDSTGLGLLVEIRESLESAGVVLRLRSVTPNVRQLLTVSGLLPLFAIEYTHPTTGVDAATLPRHASLPASSDVTFDRIAHLVARLLDVPSAAVSLVDRDGQVFPGAVGMREPYQSLRVTLLSHSLCQHVVARAAELVVPDLSADPLFADGAAARELHVAAYAGTPITGADGRVVGSLCAINDTPSEWTEDQLTDLRALAELASNELQARAAAEQARQTVAEYRAANTTTTHHLLAAALLLTQGLTASSGAVAQDIGKALQHTETALTTLRDTADPPAVDTDP